VRINVYAEELTDEVTVVEKEADTGRTFYGVRVFLRSPEELHHSPEDDDRSAITFWVPWTRSGGYDVGSIRAALGEMIDGIDSIENTLEGAGEPVT
jgi:hypothetical protein